MFRSSLLLSGLTLALSTSPASAGEPTAGPPSPARIPEFEASYLDAVPREFSLAAVSGVATRYEGWPSVSGTVNFTFYWPAIRRGSHVFISASEVNNAGGRFLGLATFAVQNVAVMDGRVEFRVFIGWDAPLRISTDILVIDP
ncbi:hypothetical protein LZ198_07940 [Myxococcus sp. K15C18031901]|uniref:hypothetical protein n=1 Tax=Myxococcus dinghuensis TaxID=2906761 RepID=UPI0020A71CBA|nr:hypothetical protein [Myxococcus dinghuensis]MCP3098804.1 hypothetical protein [Myxococcus dinghuensis]